MDIVDFPLGSQPHASAQPHTSAQPHNGAQPHIDSADGHLTRRTTSQVSCLHDRIAVGVMVADLCPQTSAVRWIDGADDVLDPAIALARLFGSFDLVAALDAVGAPGPTVLAYRPDSRRGRAAMRALPLRRWIEAAPTLWITNDGERLLMAPTDPVLAGNLVRDL